MAEKFDVSLVDAMDHAQRRHYLAQALGSMGFGVKWQEEKFEHNVDLLVEDEHGRAITVIVWMKTVAKCPRRVVQDAIASLGHFKAENALLISFAPLSKVSAKLAEQHEIIVWDRDYLLEEVDGTELSVDPKEQVTARALMDDAMKAEVDQKRDIDPDELTEDQKEALQEALKLAEGIERDRQHNKLRNEFERPFDTNAPAGPENIGPYDWQMEFHNAGAYFPERCLIAANRIGKTRSGGAEVATHMTGDYPEWWKGKRFEEAVRIWVGSDTNETSREIVQKELLGPVDAIGTGWIPKDRIVNVTYRQAGIPDVVDTVTVRHSSGGVSRLVFKTYEQGRKKWQGTSQHLVWFDEEPPLEIFTEGMTRTLDVRGLVLLTFTPLNGASETVMHFLDGGEGIWMFNATWDDAPHLSDEDKARMLASFPEHERATRAKGTPMVGSGVVFPVADEDVMVDAFTIPDHWRRIVGIDFGIDHPFAAVWMAHDADNDTIYIYDCYKATGQTAAYHADCIKKRGDWIPVSWPHDGMHRDKAGGEQLKEQYRKKGINMLPLSARYRDDKGGAVAVEPGVQEMDERMRGGSMKVFSHLSSWFREKRMYHRKDGLIVAEMDDLMSATRYALIMLRFARTQTRVIMPTKTEAYDPLARI